MTIEERFESLFKSIESHDQQIGELTERQANSELRLNQLTVRMEKGFERMEKGFERIERNLERIEQNFERIEQNFERIQLNFERIQLNFDRLTQAMLGLTDHVSNHAHRIESLEKR